MSLHYRSLSDAKAAITEGDQPIYIYINIDIDIWIITNVSFCYRSLSDVKAAITEGDQPRSSGVGRSTSSLMLVPEELSTPTRKAAPGSPEVMIIHRPDLLDQYIYIYIPEELSTPPRKAAPGSPEVMIIDRVYMYICVYI